jgi:hypothetical protein
LANYLTFQTNLLEYLARTYAHYTMTGAARQNRQDEKTRTDARPDISLLYARIFRCYNCAWFVPKRAQSFPLALIARNSPEEELTMSTVPESSKPNRTRWIIAGALGCLVVCLIVAVIGVAGFVLFAYSQPPSVEQPTQPLICLNVAVIGIGGLALFSRHIPRIGSK